MELDTKLDAKQIARVGKAVDESFKLEPSLTVVLRGKGYTLEFDNMAAKGILRDTGQNILTESGANLLDHPDHLGSILYWGLKRHHEDMTQDESDGLLVLRHRFYITKRIMEAMSLSIPDADEDNQPEGGLELTPPKNPTKPPVPSG